MMIEYSPKFEIHSNAGYSLIRKSEISREFVSGKQADANGSSKRIEYDIM
jgi:hypothetical protein